MDSIASIVPSILDLGTFSVLVVGLTGVVAKYIDGRKRDKYLPSIAVLIGVLLNVLPVVLPDAALVEAIYNGALIGGTATGWFSIVKPKSSPEKNVSVDEPAQ